jgi:hypothetical protein
MADALQSQSVSLSQIHSSLGTRLLKKTERADEMIAVVRERRALWPGDSVIAFRIASELAAAAVQVRPGESMIAVLTNKVRRRYAMEAVETLGNAARVQAEPR